MSIRTLLWMLFLYCMNATVIAQEMTSRFEIMSISEPVVLDLNTDELAALYNDPVESIILLDTRTIIAFHAYHIPNAKWIGTQIKNELIWHLDRSKLVVVYGDIGSSISYQIQQLVDMGFSRVYGFSASIHSWMKKGYKVTTATEKTKEQQSTDKLFQHFYLSQ